MTRKSNKRRMLNKKSFNYSDNYMMMRGFITFAVLLALVCSVEITKTDPYAFYLQSKTSRSKDGAAHGQLQYHGAGISDGQESQFKQWADQAIQVFGKDMYQNALSIQKKAEDNWGGVWTVEIFGGDPSWGRAFGTIDDRWLIQFEYGEYRWDYIVSQPKC